MLGTAWVPESQGATVAALIDMLRSSWFEAWSAISHLQVLARASTVSVQYRTNLSLTGEKLCIYDIERIAECE